MASTRKRISKGSNQTMQGKLGNDPICPQQIGRDHYHRKDNYHNVRSITNILNFLYQ